MKPSEFYTTARRFIDGVCAIPEMSRLLPNVTDALNGWRGARESELAGEVLKRIHEVDDAKQITELVRWSRDEYMRKWRNEEQAHAVLTQQLATERKAHEETKQRWATVSDELNGAAEECIELRKQLSATLELLTTESLNAAWAQARSAWEEGYLIGLQSHEGRSTPGGQPYEAPANPYDLVKPESFAAWKAREGGDK